jgi:hypothetical protein
VPHLPITFSDDRPLIQVLTNRVGLVFLYHPVYNPEWKWKKEGRSNHLGMKRDGGM